MLQRVNGWLKQKISGLKQQQENVLKLKKAQKYYKVLQEGAMFLQFINKDLELMKKSQLNRHQRRRFEKELYEKGKFSPEMIEYYSKKIDQILVNINQQLNPVKKTK